MYVLAFFPLNEMLFETEKRVLLPYMFLTCLQGIAICLQGHISCMLFISLTA